MFIVSDIKAKTCKNSNKIESFLQENQFFDFSQRENYQASPKINKKNSTSINSSYQTNYSLSRKGSSSFSFQEQIASDEINDSLKNDFLGKKKYFFKVNYTKKPKEENLDNNIKKLRKINTNEIKVRQEGRWTEEENLRFLEGIYNYGNDWKEVKAYVGTRSSNQVRSHAQKFIIKIKTFKDDSLGIDFTDKIIKNLVDIVYVIKEAKEKSKNDNIIVQLCQKLSEKNFKNGGTPDNLEINNTDKKLIINKENRIEKNLNEKKVNNFDKQNNDKNEPEIIIDNSIINDEIIKIEKKEKEKDDNDNKNKKEILECNQYYSYNNENNENIDTNKMEIINGIAFETNKNFFKPFNTYNSIEINTISIINNRYYS